MKNEHLIKYKNPVIIKDQEGKVRQTTYDLPQSKHSYGKKVTDDPEPIKNVVNGWNYAKESAEIPSKQKNFQALNKQSAINGFSTSKHQTHFRKYNDIMVKGKKGQKMIPILLPEEQFTYGVENRPSTPVKLIIGNCYALQQQNKNATMYQTEAMKHPKNKTVAHKTKSQKLREDKVCKEKEYRNKPIDEDKFKISKFVQKSGPKINSNLSAFQAVAKTILSQDQQPNQSTNCQK